MARLLPNEHHIEAPPAPSTTLIDDYTAVHRQYLRAREYCGVSLDEIINSRRAKNLLKDIWLLGCLVRKPRKAETLPALRVDDWSM
ncbi:MAG TPA: hypothetical protein VEJ63_17565 [Planctomycetota bacterium]|nr:hypothetical protein [Planctomycetota bacterium]